MSGEGQDDQLDDNASQFGGPGAPTPLGQLEVLAPPPVFVLVGEIQPSLC